MVPYSQNNEEILQSLQTDKKTGLAAAEVLNRQQKYGANKLKEKKKNVTNV